MSKKGGGSVTQPFQNNSNSSSTSTGASSGTSSATGTTTVNTPANWITNWDQQQPGQNGLNPLQATGANWMQGALNNGDPANLAAARPGLNLASGYFSDTLQNRTAPTLRNLAAIDPGAYGVPADVTAQNITARRGSEFMSGYQNPFQTQVVDASLGQYDQDSAEARNSLRANNAGAFGNKRFGVAEGQFASDSALGRSTLGAGLRSQGFNTAAGLGMQDASRFLQADASNADRALQASTFNNTMRNNRQQFDSQTGMAYNNQRDQLGRDLSNVSGQIAGLGTTGFNIGQGLAGGLVNTGATGANQGINWLNAAVPTFGQTNTQNNTQNNTQTNTGTGTENQSGFQTGINQNGGKGGALGGLGSLMQGAGALAAFCWVAREVYGADNPKWLNFREWMLNHSPKWFRNLYIKYGERFAAWVSDKPRIKSFIRFWMDARVASLRGVVI